MAIQIDPDGLTPIRRRLAMLTICLGVLLSGLDGVIVNVALPSIARGLSVSPAASVWAATAYQLAMIVSLLPMAALGEAAGYRRVYWGGMALFTASSLACALSHSLGALLAWRIVQGAGGGAMVGVSLALVRFIYPRRLLGGGIALYGLMAAISLTIGPTVAGAILAAGPWQWLFAVNLPIGAVALALGARLLPPSPRIPRPFDGAGAVLTGLMLIALVSGVDALGDEGGLPRALGLLVAFALLAAVLVRHQRSRTAPLLPLDLLGSRAFSLTAATSVCAYAAQTTAFVALPFFLQQRLGLSVVRIGLLITPWPMALALSAPVAGRLADRWRAGGLTAVGLAGMTAGLLLLAVLGPGAAVPDIVWRMALCGVGMGLFQAPNNRGLMTAAPPERSGAASGMVAVARMLGMALGSATAAMSFGLFAAHGSNAAVLIAAVLAAVACLFSLARAAN